MPGPGWVWGGRGGGGGGGRDGYHHGDKTKEQ